MRLVIYEPSSGDVAWFILTKLSKLLSLHLLINVHNALEICIGILHSYHFKILWCLFCHFFMERHISISFAFILNFVHFKHVIEYMFFENLSDLHLISLSFLVCFYRDIIMSLHVGWGGESFLPVNVLSSLLCFLNENISNVVWFICYLLHLG